MSKLIFTPKCPANAIIQHLESGNYDYSEHLTLEKAAEAVLHEWYDSNHELSKEQALQQSRDSLAEYSREEIMQAAENDYAWPFDLGFVEILDQP